MSKPTKPKSTKPFQGGRRPSTPDAKPTEKGHRPSTPDAKPASSSAEIKNGK